MAMSAAKPTQPREYTRHSQFWLEDGNIILVASDTVGFRVHRSVLAMKSGVFRDMFSFPQPDASDTSRQTSDYPVLHLPDSPDDLAYFLDAMYHGMRYCFDKNSRPTWAAVKALLLLGNKYDAEELYGEGLRCLSLQFPKDIADWDAVYNDEWFISGKQDALAIEMANVCRFLGLAEYHVPALYLCSILPTETLECGAGLQEDEDAIKVRLNPDDVKVCLAARSELGGVLQMNLEFLVEELPSQEGSRCHDADLCDAAVERLQEGVNWPTGLDSQPFAALDPFWWSIDSIMDLCPNCEDWLHAQYAEIRQDVRKALHTYIVIPTY